MNIFPLIHFSAFLVYIYLSVFIIRQNPKAWLNRAFSVLFVALSIWSFSFIFVHNTHVSKETARLFMKISSVGWLGDLIILLWIAFLFVKIRFRGWVITVLMFFSMGFFSYYIWTDQIISDFSMYYYGWGLSYHTDSPIFYIWGCFYAVIFAFQLSLLVICILRSTSNTEKKQIWLVFISSVISVVAGTTIDVVFPVIDFHLVPDVSDIVFLVWAILVIYAMVRYRFLTLTPEMAAEDILATMADSLILVSHDGRIISVNRYTQDLLGYSSEELEGETVKTLFFEQENNPFTGNNLRELTANGYLKDFNVSYKTKNGEKIPMSFSGSIMRDEDENLVGVVCILRDIRETLRLIRKERELAVTETAARTEREKSEELAAAYGKLKDTQAMLIRSEKLRALGQLGADVAHELNNPLAGILLLMKKYKNRVTEESEEIEDIKEMEIGLEFMARIIKDLNDFTISAAGEFKEIDCNEIISSILGFTANQMEQRKIKIEKDLEKHLPFVHGEKRQLQQMLINILNNARDAIGKVGVIKISSRSVDYGHGRFVEIKIEDNGSGMKKEVQDRMFDHFFTTKRPGGGVGLGLSIVHAILKSHHGDINVSSETGKGSIFIVRLPALEQRT